MDDHMEVDDFDEFDLEPADIIALQIEEELYLSSQQTQTQQATATATRTSPIPVKDQSTLVPDTPSTEQTTQPRPSYSQEEGTIEDLKFQLQRLKLQTASHADERHKKELAEAKDIIHKKDLELLRLKKELANVKDYPIDSQKRPLLPPPPSQHSAPSHKRPSPFPKHSFYSQQPRINEFPPSKHTLSSLAFMTPPPSTATSQSLSSTQPPPPPRKRPPTTTQSSQVKNKAKSQFRMRSKPTETEKNNTLYTVLFTPLFNVWNVQHHNNTKNINVCLTPSRVKYFAGLFSEQFIPNASQCSTPEIQQNLSLLASDMSKYLVKSDYADGTIRLLMDVLNLCLTICIKDKLFEVIQNIIWTVNTLASTFSVASGYLYHDLIMDKNSILKNISHSLALFPFHHQNKSNLLMMEVPDIQSKSMTQIMKLSEIYEVSPIELSVLLSEKKMPVESTQIIQSMIELFYSIGSINDRPIFNYLLEDTHFLNLLWMERPQDLVLGAVSVLETNFMGNQVMEGYADHSILVVHRLTDMITSSQGPWTWQNWFQLRVKSMLILLSMARAKLSEDMIVEIHKLIFTKTNLVLDDIKRDFIKYKKEGPHIRQDQCERLIVLCLRVIHCIIMNCPKDIFQHVKSPCAAEVARFLNLFRNLGLDEDHPATNVLEDIQKYMDIYLPND